MGRLFALKQKRMKPCPFCGNTELEPETDHLAPFLILTYIRCKYCDARGPSIYNDESDDPEQDAIDIWNDQIHEPQRL